MKGVADVEITRGHLASVLMAFGGCCLTYAVWNLLTFRRAVREDIQWLNMHFGESPRHRFEAAYELIVAILVAFVVGLILVYAGNWLSGPSTNNWRMREMETHDAESSRRYQENWADAVRASKADAAKIEQLSAALRGMLDALPSNRIWDEPAPNLNDVADRLMKAKTAAESALVPAPRSGDGSLNGETETRGDGAIVRKDRWEWTVRRIVALLWGNRKEFECDDVVEGVRVWIPCTQATDDAEALVHAAQKRFGAGA